MRVADQLAKRGIPKSDVVIAFQLPYARKEMEGYAIA
ncbi:MAG: element excision factor XisI family protein [Saprospiraceae bacterium]